MAEPASFTLSPEGPGHEPHLWAVVLAGGEGVRLRPLVKQVCGDERPKQYAPVMDPRTLLRQTLDRIARFIPPERTVVVSVNDHRHFLLDQLPTRTRLHVLMQPGNRGTAAGILFPSHWIARRDPGAIIAVFPSDHCVQDEDRFISHVARVAAVARATPEWMVLVGARPRGPEVEYGWIERGAAVDHVDGRELCRVRAFREKPSAAEAEALFARGGLWNTLVLVTPPSVLLGAAAVALPDMNARLAQMVSFVGTEYEVFARGQAYALMGRANFSSALLQTVPSSLAVSELPDVGWADLGTPRRVFEALRGRLLSPPWLEPAGPPHLAERARILPASGR